MTIPPLSHTEIGLKSFPQSSKKKNPRRKANFFDLSSHARAKESIEFALKMRHGGFHVFVVGEDRSGRMSSTLEYLQEHVKSLDPPRDWVYVNNFAQTQRPLPYSLPSGMGDKLKKSLQDLIHHVITFAQKTFGTPDYLAQVDQISFQVQQGVQAKIDALQLDAKEKGYQVAQSDDGFAILHMKDNAPLTLEEFATTDVIWLRTQLTQFMFDAQLAQKNLDETLLILKKNIAEKILTPLIKPIQNEFGDFLNPWLDDLYQDIIKNIDHFLEAKEDEDMTALQKIKDKYAVNLLVDNRLSHHPTVLLEPNPTYETLFGSIKYVSSPSGYETNFTMIRPGALHLANGGILVLRADAIAHDPDLWDALKGALRDRRIRIYERYRENSMPLLDAPEPKSIPLDIQVFIIGSPFGYYNFFFQDPEFRTYFKVKAEIHADMPASAENVSIYRQLIEQTSLAVTGIPIEQDGCDLLVSYSSRWVCNRDKLSAQFEQIADVLYEASTWIEPACVASGKGAMTKKEIKSALDSRRTRNMAHQELALEQIFNNTIRIDTSGVSVGQINGLSVIQSGDSAFGMPARISARTFVSEEGVINIERLIDMSGPIQQKGAMILEGFLHAQFAQEFPVSCGCSLTFEQNYAGIEGDSASLAELLAILSSLSEIPIRQDIAVTGAIDQFGAVQAVGGIHHKIESFFFLCQKRGFTGQQGVVIPYANIENLTILDEIKDVIESGIFHIWAVKNIEEAIGLLMNKPAGNMKPRQLHINRTVYGAVAKKLRIYHQILLKR